MKYFFLLHAIIFFSLFTAWPIEKVIELSFLKTNFISTVFVGFDNYFQALNDSNFIISILNSLFYCILMIPGQLFLGLGSAFLIFKLSKKWQDISRIIFYIPVLAAGIIIAQIWRWIFHIQGLFNWIIGLIGIAPINYFGDWFTAIPSIAFIVIVSSFGANTIIFLASMQSIDKSLFEAAEMDGASWRQVKYSIMIPMIMPSISLVILLSAIASFGIFETIYSLAPQSYAATMTYGIYRTGFLFSKYGLASAEAIIFLIIILSLSLIKNRIEKRD